MKKLFERRTIVFVLVFTLLTGVVRGDGLDLDYLTKVDSSIYSNRYIWAVVISLMVMNYLLNFVVVGYPVMLEGLASTKKIVFGLIGLTLLGQIADKIGGVFAEMVSISLESSTVEGDLSASTASGIVLCANFVFSGAAVGILVLGLLRLWKVPRPFNYKVAAAAAVFTNPAWALLILLVKHGPI